MSAACKRCGKLITEYRRRTYCSEGCADAASHEKRLQRLAQGKLQPKVTYRVYDYRDKEV